MKRVKVNSNFKSMALVLFALVLSSNVWGADPNDYIPVKSFNNSTAGSYQSSMTGDSHEGISCSMGNVIPSSGQMKLNQGNTTSVSASNWYVYNTEAFPGSITKVELVISDGTTTADYFRIATSSSAAISDNGTWDGTTASSLSSKVHTWTFNSTDGITYFRICCAKNGGTVKADKVNVYYSISSKTATTTSFGAGVDDQTFAAEVGGTFATKTATVKANGSAVAGATVTYSSSAPAVASVNASTGAITINAKGTTDITATYEGDATYASSSAKYTISVTNPNEVVLWSEDWGDGTDGYTLVNGGSDTKLFNETLAGGTSPELLVGKSTGSMTTPTISLAESTSPYVLTFKSNKSGLTVSSATTGVSVGEISLVSGSTYTCIITVPANTPSITLTFSNTLGENARLDDMELVGTAASCTNKITITKGTETNGTFELSQTGEVCIDESNATVNVTDITPAEHYHFNQITATNGTVDNEDKRVTNISANTTINVEFAEDTKYTISFLDNIQLEEVASKEVYGGATFTFPVLTDKTAKTEGTCEQVHYHFMGWVISTHTGEIEAGDIKTGTSAAVNADATYKAVWAKEQ